MKSIVLNIDSKCNAKCSHCCFSCSPSAKQNLSDQELNHILDYIVTNKEIEVVSITGGEALLRKKKVYEILERISESGKSCTLITNGYWARNLSITKKYLSELFERGLRSLTISYDDYHAKFIPPQNIINLLTVLKEFNISIALNMVVDKKNKGIHLLEELGESAFGVPITMVPASPVGEAKNLDNNDLYYNDVQTFDLKCPAQSWEFVIHHDGYIYPCCSPSVFETALRIGDIRENSIPELENKLFSNIALYILQKEGLSWFIAKLGLDLNNLQFTSTCEICRFIFKDSNNLNLIIDDMVEYYEKNIENV